MRKIRRLPRPAWPTWLHVQSASLAGENVLLDVVISTAAIHTRIVGSDEGCLKIAVQKALSKQQINRHLIRLMAERLRVETAQISITAGHTSRQKRISLLGVSPEHVVAELTA